MQKITIGFSTPKKWRPFAWLIMTGYGIPYNHVFIELHSTKYDRKLIYQASGSKINFMGEKLFHDENIVISSYEVEIDDDSYVRMMQFAIDNAGRSYGIKQALGMAIVRVAEVLGIKIRNPFKDGTNTFVCSELAAYVLENFAGVDIDRDLDDITPKDLFDYFKNLSDAQAAQLPKQPTP